MDRLRAAGYAGQFTPLEEGVRRYVQDHLRSHRPLRMISVLLFPQFNPVLVQLGPFGIRWYALAYIASLVIGWRLLRRLVARPPAVATPVQVDDFLTWATLGVVLGGRLGYVLFYQPARVFRPSGPDPRRLGRRHELPWRHARRGRGDRHLLPAQRHPAAGLRRPVAVCAPIGLGLGRHRQLHQRRAVGTARAAVVAGAMVFPNAEPCPRSRSMSAAADGVRGLDPPAACRAIPASCTRRCWKAWCCSCVMLLLSRRRRLRARFGWLTGAFLIGYGIARITGECFREPDAFLGFLPFGTTMGQVLCIPMLVAGAWLIWRARPVVQSAPSAPATPDRAAGRVHGTRQRRLLRNPRPVSPTSPRRPRSARCSANCSGCGRR